MIISVFNKDSSSSSKYSFTETLVQLGRNPSGEASVLVDSQTISRNHLKARVTTSGIEIMDLNSSNGTFRGDQQLQPNIWISITSLDQIKLAEFDGYLTFEVREQSIKPKKSSSLIATKGKVLRQSSSNSDSSEKSRSRSREKEKEPISLPFKISESTLKMLKDMTINKKSKEERIKFLKLMGIGMAAEYWTEIEQLLKSKKGIKDGKKITEELERQFTLGRSGVEKRGLGK